MRPFAFRMWDVYRIPSRGSECFPGRNGGGHHVQMQYGVQQYLHEDISRGAHYAGVPDSLQQVQLQHLRQLLGRLAN